ncbi:hypothetical protein DC89_004087 [Escherichia coli]|uniref:hypothetical protein n=1 Tax=Escherichia coli TaxID=562 RepID=UPI0017E855C7|nr:hypothetical protein [Escherichia coli]EGK2900667.1 hypothetical protein [Escherichia coli]EID2721584.1 hypothetical protein [Escherichia coli]BEB33633.1 hypothetical protein VEE40_09090 [Escherichia coli]HCO7111135.1 hypothetical protein [Escherichia coli]
MADTIRDYLVSLGFDIDGAGQAKFEATLKGVAANVVNRNLRYNFCHRAGYLR